MSNRLLSLFILIIIFSGIYGVYYYFFVANVGILSLIVSGADVVSVDITSEFKNTYHAECSKLCIFRDIPPVGYTLVAKKDGYVTITKSFRIERGQSLKMPLRLEREVTLKEMETPTVENTSTGSEVNTDSGTTLTGSTTVDTNPSDSLTKTIQILGIDISETILSIKDTANPDIRIVTGEKNVYTYSLSTKTATVSELYDDILPLPSGDLVVLVRKTSKTKLSLLNLDDNGNDSILLVNNDKRTRKTLLQTPKDGQYLEYVDKKLILVGADAKRYEVENVE